MQLFSSTSRSLRPSTLARVAALAVVFGIGNPLLNAQVFTEIGDAGQTPGTAQNSGIVQAAGGTGRSTVLGTFLSPTDADVYRLTINAPGTFSISTLNTLTQSNGGPGGLDTQLFIFDAAGHPIVMNDDANGLALQSTIPSATPFMSALAAGIYYIAISLAGNDPVNINNQLMFAMNGGNTTAIRGPASGTNPSTWSDFNGGTFFAQQGAYQIDITTVPDNGSTLLLIGVAFMGLALLHRRVTAPAQSRG